MAKKSSPLNYVYAIGMAVTAIGFMLPIFSAFGGNITMNGFNLVGKGDSIMKIAVLLVFIGAVAGVAVQFIPNNSLYKIIALIVTVAGGLYCFFNTSDVGIKLAGKFLGTGFYMIIIGWCIAAAGIILKRK
jgi:hypothetical protein